MKLDKRAISIILLALILGSYLAVQIPRIDFFYVISDEALYAKQAWYISKNPAEFFNPEITKYYVPLVPLIVSPLNFFLGPLPAVRIGVLIFSALAILLVFLLAKKMFSTEIGLISAALLAFSPTFLYYSTIAFLDIPLTAFALIAIYFAINPLEKKWKIVMASAAIYAAKIIGALMFPVIIATTLLAREKSIGNKYLLKIAALFLAITLISIFFLYLLGITTVIDVIHYLLGTGISPNLLLSFLLMGQQLVVYTLGYAIIPFLLLGIMALGRMKKEKRKFAILTIWVFTIIGIFTIFNIIKSRYFLPAIPALAIISAFGIQEIIPKRIMANKTRIACVFLLTAIVCAGAVSSSSYLKMEKALFKPLGYDQLQAYMEQNFGREDVLVVFGNEFPVRGIRLYAEIGMQENWKKALQNPSEEEFETVLGQAQGKIFVIYDKLSASRKDSYTAWFFGEKITEEYLAEKGFENQKEIIQLGVIMTSGENPRKIVIFTKNK